MGDHGVIELVAIAVVVTRTFTLPLRMDANVHSNTLEPASVPKTTPNQLSTSGSSNMVAGTVTMFATWRSHGAMSTVQSLETVP